jgi:hypothetical protein
VSGRTNLRLVPLFLLGNVLAAYAPAVAVLSHWLGWPDPGNLLYAPVMLPLLLIGSLSPVVWRAALAAFWAALFLLSAWPAAPRLKAAGPVLVFLYSSTQAALAEWLISGINALGRS